MQQPVPSTWCSLRAAHQVALHCPSCRVPQMRAIVCESLGDPTLPLGSGVLRLVSDAASPALKPGHVRIRVAAAALNFPDALQIQVG